MNITPKGAIAPMPIVAENSEEFSLFQDRQKLHGTIEGFEVYINQYAWNAFLSHSMNVYKLKKHEAQGIFLGKYFKDASGEFAVVTEYCEGVGESQPAFVSMSEVCVADISKKCADENLVMLIWIHTHPNFGVFYSPTDIKCLKTNFFMPFQSGIVVDIIRKESKGFKVADGEVEEFSGYHIYDTSGALEKPYASKTAEKKAKSKKNESPEGGASVSQEIFTEPLLIKSKPDIFQKVEQEPSASGNDRKEVQEQSLLQQATGADWHKTYFDQHFKAIREQLDQSQDDVMHSLAAAHDWFRRVLLISLSGIYILLGTEIIVLVYFLTRSFSRH